MDDEAAGQWSRVVSSADWEMADDALGALGIYPRDGHLDRARNLPADPVIITAGGREVRISYDSQFGRWSVDVRGQGDGAGPRQPAGPARRGAPRRPRGEGPARTP
jgi:hypothetical protein